jgi:hypothetical protein
VIETKARVFILGDPSSVPEEWAAAIIVGHHKMQEILDANLGPFFVSVRKRADGIVERLRLPRGYQPPAETIAEKPAQSLSPAVSEPKPLITEIEKVKPDPSASKPSKPGNLFS